MHSNCSLYLAPETGKYPNSRFLDITKKIEGAGIKFTGSIEPCDMCLANKRKQLAHPKGTEYNVAKPLELVYTDIVGPIYPKSLENFRYIHELSGRHAKHLVGYYSETTNNKVRVLKDCHHDLAVSNRRKIQRLRTDCRVECTPEEYRAVCKKVLELDTKLRALSPLSKWGNQKEMEELPCQSQDIC